MIPPIIEDSITKVTDSSQHHERRQFYASSLEAIKKEIDKALAKYDSDRKKVAR